MYKPKPISGFPEWLPEVRKVELMWLDTIREIFESYGFCSLETPAVEELAVLAAKGETADKEIYAISRLNDEQSHGTSSRFGLHYDLTVPFARYVAQHFGALTFPFKRYQMQKVWRGERPQEGRYREFYQCDIDVVNLDVLPLAFDAALPSIVAQVLDALDVGSFQLRVSNRKILQGYLSGLGITEVEPVIRAIDKLAKIGKEGVVKILCDEQSLSSSTAEQCLAIAEIRVEDLTFAERVCALDVQSEELDLGIEELSYVMTALSKVFNQMPQHKVVADLSIARGFNYYTGSIYEGELLDYPDLGSIVAGGRYDDLTSSYSNKHIPGVGISIGLSRMFGKLSAAGALQIGAQCPTQILVCWLPGLEFAQVTQTARALRARGFNVEAYHGDDKMKKQIRYADRKGIPYVWFPNVQGSHEVKCMTTGEQSQVDVASFEIV